MSEDMKEYYEGEFFVDFDKETEMYGVFHTDYKQGHCFSLNTSEVFAEKDAKSRNQMRLAAIRHVGFRK